MARVVKSLPSGHKDLSAIQSPQKTAVLESTCGSQAQGLWRHVGPWDLLARQPSLSPWGQ